MSKNNKHKNWFRPRGYIHITEKLQNGDKEAIRSLIKNQNYIANHAFYPLVCNEIKERRKSKKIKKRPIAYASHLDTQIFSYYAYDLKKKYERRIKNIPRLDCCITAYRTIKDKNGKGKRNIHFAFEAFELIKEWSDCTVLTFDIKSFFSTIDHILLKKAWCNQLEQKSLPPDSYNVFRAVTNYSYILLDELKNHYRGFDEEKLANLRKKGIQSFFENPKDFRESVIENPNVHVFKNRKKIDNRYVGIPQGLPISPILANIYMLEFDRAIYNELISTGICDYRRYSDDILIVCKSENAIKVEKRVKELLKKKTRLILSPQKKERFTCENKKGRLEIMNLENGKNYLTYLGFEFYGYKSLIKSSTLAKYYRRTKKALKTKIRRLDKTYEKNLLVEPVLYKRKLLRNFTHHGTKSKKIIVPKYTWEQIAEAEFIPKKKMVSRLYWGNFISYAKKSSEVFKDRRIKRQVRKHRKHFETYLKKQLEKFGFEYE